MNYSSAFIFSIWATSACVACTRVSSTPLESPSADATTDASAPRAGPTSSAAGPGKDLDDSGAAGSTHGMDAAQGTSNEPVPPKSTGDTRFGVHKPGDDTRVNSGAGDPTPLDATERGAR